MSAKNGTRKIKDQPALDICTNHPPGCEAFAIPDKFVILDTTDWYETTFGSNQV
jgi:hypothetical protein